MGVGGEPDISPLANLGWTPRDGNHSEGSPKSPRSWGGWERVLPDIAIWEQDSHSQVGLARLSAQAVEPSEKFYCPPGGTLVSPAGSHNPVGAVSFEQAMLVANWPFFGKGRMGRSAPCLEPRSGFSFFLY